MVGDPNHKNDTWGPILQVAGKLDQLQAPQRYVGDRRRIPPKDSTDFVGQRSPWGRCALVFFETKLPNKKKKNCMFVIYFLYARGMRLWDSTGSWKWGVTR